MSINQYQRARLRPPLENKHLTQRGSKARGRARLPECVRKGVRQCVRKCFRKDVRKDVSQVESQKRNIEEQ